jgi:hypothetical protein
MGCTASVPMLHTRTRYVLRSRCRVPGSNSNRGLSSKLLDKSDQNPQQIEKAVNALDDAWIQDEAGVFVTRCA